MVADNLWMYDLRYGDYECIIFFKTQSFCYKFDIIVINPKIIILYNSIYGFYMLTYLTPYHQVLEYRIKECFFI